MAGIAQRVLGNLLGEYIDGLDKNNINVGIWSGDFKIENVALKRDLADKFNLPFDFKFNHVGRISAKIPWKSLSNSPVEVEFEDLLVIAQPKSQEDLLRIAINVFNDRQKFLETFAANLEEKLKKGGKEEAPGYFAGLITKIVDNVQVSIKNIHIRFECSLDKNCSFNFGITMDTLNIYTTDERGNKIFIDRSKSDNAKLPVNKKLVLDDFSFYWNENGMAPIAEIKLQRNAKGELVEPTPMSSDQRARVVAKLKSTIISGMGKKKDRVNDFNYLVNLSIDAKMIQYKKTQDLIDRGIPEIELTFNLDKISSILTKGQFGQIMSLMNYFSDYMAMAKKEQEKLRFKYLRPLKSISRAKKDTPAMRSNLRRQWWRFAFKAIKKEKQESSGFFTVLRMDKKQRHEYVEKFKMLFSKIDYNSGKDYSTFLTPDEIEIYQVITLSLDEVSLRKAVEDLLKEKQKLVKKESKKGWFSWGSSKQTDLTADEEKEIEDLISQVVKLEEDKFNTPDSFKWLRVKFIQREAYLSLQRMNSQKQNESVDILFSNFELTLQLRKSGMDVDLSLQNLEVTSKTEVSKYSVITDQIFRPLIETNPENHLVDLTFSTEPEGHVRKGTDKQEKLDMYLKLAIKSSEIFYNQKMINTLVDVFDNKAQIDALKKAATEQAELVSQQSQQKLNEILRTQKTVIVDISIAAPLIVLPFNQAEMVTSECWVMSPGILKIIGDNFNEDTRKDRGGYEHYDSFMIGLENIKIEYMPSILDYMETYTPSQIKNTKNKMIPNLIQNKAVMKNEGKISNYPQFDLLKNFNITLDLNVLKPAYVQLNFKEPRFKVSAYISKLQVDLNQKIYSDTLRFGDIFKDSTASSPQLQMDKKSLLLSAAKYDSVIRGNAITGFSKVKDYAVLSQGRLYYFKDRKEQAAYDYFLLKDAKVKLLSEMESGHPFAIKIESPSGSQMLAFENDNSRTDWVIKIENECRKLRVQAAQPAPEASASTETASEETKAVDLAKSKPGQAQELPKTEHVAFVQLNMEELNMRVFNVNTQMFDFAITHLGVMVDVKDTETKVKVTLEKINILDTKETDANLKTLISSEIGSSIATKVVGLGVSSEHTSKTLVNIDVILIDPKSPKYDKVDTDIIINFGSLFVNLRPSQINRLMVFFVPPSPAKPQQEEETPSDTSNSASNVAVVNRTKSLVKRENDKVIQVRVKFTLERISLIMVNEIKNIYLSHASISAISIEFESKLTGMKLQGTLSNLQLHDLTNYPNTLTVSDFSRIVPTELFGISQKIGASSLITLGFEKINSDIAELEEENVSGYLNVGIEQIQVNFYMQVVMRILDYVLTHVLPALSTDSPTETVQHADETAQLASASAKMKVNEALAINNLKNPFWMKMDINIVKPIVILKCAPHYTESLQIELGNIKIFNQRVLNTARVKYNNADKRWKELEIGEEFPGVWTETYFISMTDLSIKKIVEQDNKDYYKYFMHPFNFNLSVEMVQYVDDYKVLFNAETNDQYVYTDYSLNKRTIPITDQSSPNLLLLDVGMAVRARISPMVMIFGNYEFNFIMKILFHNITYNDFQDASFNKKLEGVQPQPKQTKKIDAKDQIEEPTGSNMSITIDIDYLAMVSMETGEVDKEGFDGNRIKETRMAYAKLFIKELRVDMLMKSSGDMEIGLYIRRLIGSYLQDKEADSKTIKVFEKGFIGKMSIYQEFLANNCDELRGKIVQELNESISEKGDAASYGLTAYKKENLMLNVEIIMESQGEKNITVSLSQMRILAQTDVLLKLSGLAQMSPDCTPPEPAAVDPKEKSRILQEQAMEKEKRIAEIKEYFNRKLLRSTNGSLSMSAVSDNRLKHDVIMRVNVDIKKVMFVIPTKEHHETLVTSGDLAIRIEMYDQKDKEELWEYQKGLTKSKKSLDTVESQNLAMKLNLSLMNFQIFYCDFAQLLKNPWRKVPKRHILMPIKMVINYFDFNPVTKVKDDLVLYSFKKIEGAGESLIFKLTLSDIDVLSRIAAYQMKLLEEASPKKPETPKAIEPGSPEHIEDPIEKALHNVEAAHKQDELLRADPVKPQGSSADAEVVLPHRLSIPGFKISGLQLFLINDDQKIFVPVLDFVISNILLDMRQSTDLALKLTMGLGVDYYNPNVSKWEPFVEKTNIIMNLCVNDKNNVKTTHVFFKLDDLVTKDSKASEEILNVNLSIKALAVVMRSLATFAEWNKKRAEEEKRIKNDQSLNLFSHIVGVEDKQDAEENAQTASNGLTVEEKVETILEAEQEKIDYVSPYMIKNLTGYPINAEEYVNKTYFVEDDSKGALVEKPSQSNKGKKSEFKRDRLGTVYSLLNEESLNLKLETASKFKKNEGEQKFTLEEQMSDALLMVTIRHDQFKINSLYDLPLDQQYSQRKRLDGDHKIIGEFSVICDNYFDDMKKTLTISSTVLLENLSNIGLTFRILKKKDQKLDIQLNPRDLKPVPFDLVASNYQIVYNGSTTDIKELQKFSNKEDGYCQKITLAKDLHLLARVKRDPEIYQRIIIVLLPIIKFKNCLPFPLEYTLEQDGVEPHTETLMPQQDTQVYRFDPDLPIKLKTRAQGLRFSEAVTIVDKNRDCDVDEVVMKDLEGNKASLKLARISNNENIFTYYLYADAVLMNESSLDLKPVYVSAKGAEQAPVAGTSPIEGEVFNKNLLILNSVDSNIKLQLTQEFLDANFPNFKNVKQADMLPLKALDAMAYNCLIENKAMPADRRLFELGVYLSPLYVDKTENIYTKVIQISPRNIFYNCTEYAVQLKQADTDTVQEIGPNQRAPYWWASAGREKKLQVMVPALESEWSQKFDAKILGAMPMALKLKDSSSRGFYYEVKIDSASEFTYFKEIPTKDPFFSFLNESTKFNVEVFQKGTEAQLSQKIEHGKEQPFAWIAPDINKTAVVKLSAEGFPDTYHEIDISKINTNERIKITGQDKVTERFVNIGIVLRKTTKFVKVRDVIDVHGETKAEQQIDQLVTTHQFVFDLFLNGLGLSLISPYRDTRIEPLYVYLGGIETMMSFNDHHTMVHFKLKTINLDNNTTPITPFPVIMTPSFKEKAKRQEFSLITFKMEKRNESKPEIQLYDELVIDIQPITLGIDDIALEVILEVVATVQKTMAAKPHVRYQHKYFHIVSDEETPNLSAANVYQYPEARDEWQIKEPAVSQTWIYAKEFKISVLDLTLSYKTRAQEAKNKLLGFGTIFKSLGVALVNIDEANIKIRGVKFEHVFETNDSLVNKLMQHYKDNGIKQGLKIIGSIDILGNPVNLFTNIGTGVVDFFEKPIEGFAKGPLDAAKGLGQGTVSLVKNTTQGVLNSASKATGAVSSAFSALTMDDEFIKNREKMRVDKSKNIFVGVGKGFKSVGVGVFEGVTGIITQPLRGARQGGIVGLFKGIARGLVGIVTKPLTGVFDLASHTTEGMKSMVTYFDDRANEVKKRMPRAFYGRERYFKKYNESEAALLNELKVFDDGKYAFDHFIKKFDISQFNGGEFIFIVTFEHIIYFNQTKHSIVFVIEPENITSIEKEAAGLKVLYNDSSKIRDTSLLIKREEDIEDIINTVNEVRYVSLCTSHRIY